VAIASAVLAFAIAAPALAISIEDVKTLVGLEVPDEQIIKKIEKDGSVFKLSPSDIMALKKKGASDKLIKYMLQTAQSVDGGKPKEATKPKVEAEKRELTAAEQAAEEARLKEESMRLADEQRRRDEASRKAFAGKVLAQGQRYANDGEFVKAIQVFNKFVEDGIGGIPFAPDSNEAYVAKYGIANALARAGLIQSAANMLLEVVRAGSDKMFFQQAFDQLRDLRRKINYRPPELEDLTRFSVSNTDAAFQDSYYYFVGEFLLDFGLGEQARPYLEKVTRDGNDYARSQYLLGLLSIPTEEKDKITGQQVADASQAFQKAVLAGEKRADGQAVVDLAFLALARLAYDIEQFDAAIYYYKKISKNSPKLATAFYEAGWTYFLKNDVSRALGTFHALHSPYFAHHFYPEMWVLEATVYSNLCQVERAEAAVEMFNNHVLVLGPPLRDFLKRNRRPDDFYASFVESSNHKTAASLPRPLQSPVMENVEFYNLYQTIKQIEKEEKIIKASLGPLGTFGQDLLGKLGQLRTERSSEAGVVIQKTLKQTQKDIETYQDKLSELKIDIDTLKLNKIDDKISGVKTEEGKGDSGGTIAIAGSDSMVWPFEGEFWKDEIGAYRSFVRSQCAADDKQ